MEKPSWVSKFSNALKAGRAFCFIKDADDEKKARGAVHRQPLRVSRMEKEEKGGVRTLTRRLPANQVGHQGGCRCRSSGSPALHPTAAVCGLQPCLSWNRICGVRANAETVKRREDALT